MKDVNLLFYIIKSVYLNRTCYLYTYIIEQGNKTDITNNGDADLTVESRLLAVVLLLTLLVAIALLISFYTEIAGKPTERNMVTGVLLGITHYLVQP